MAVPSTAIYMRIRHYVFDWLAGTDGSVVKLPSNRVLAQKFEVSQPTVVKALQELIKEGYLLMRPGVGLFSNPDRLWAHNSHLWGIVLGDGRSAHLSREMLSIIYLFGDEIQKRGRCHLLKLINMGVIPDKKNDYPELSILSGLCWWLPEDDLLPAMRRLAEKIPVAVIGKRVPGFFCYYTDFESRNYETASRMIARGCRRPAVFLPAFDEEGAIRGIRRACDEAGVELRPDCLFSGNLSCGRTLAHVIDGGYVPDGIIFNHVPQDFLPAVRSRPELADCLLYCDSLSMPEDHSFNGFLGYTDYAGIAPSVVDFLFSGKTSAPPEARVLPFRLQESFPVKNS